MLRTIDLLASYGFDDIHLAGKGYGAVVAALAGLLEPQVTQVTLTKNLTSWHAVATAGLNSYNWPLALLPSGVLEHFDMPDVKTALIASKSLTSTSEQSSFHSI